MPQKWPCCLGIEDQSGINDALIKATPGGFVIHHATKDGGCGGSCVAMLDGTKVRLRSQAQLYYNFTGRCFNCDLQFDETMLSICHGAAEQDQAHDHEGPMSLVTCPNCRAIFRMFLSQVGAPCYKISPVSALLCIAIG